LLLNGFSARKLVYPYAVGALVPKKLFKTKNRLIAEWQTDE
jgi:hypothetical protein